MTSFSIIYKNFRYNFMRYISFFLVNSFIVSILFIYGSLIFNDILVSELGRNSICKILKVFSMSLIPAVKPLGHSSIYKIMKATFGSIVVFSTFFISYTNIAFIKYRRKEFGILLTLGMTTKDLIKISLIENAAVILSSLITGIITGTVFLNLFYMTLKRVLMLEDTIYDINIKTFISSAGVFVIIFLINSIFNGIYIKKLTIIETTKPSAKKETGKSKIVLGALSLIIFIISMYFVLDILQNDGDIIMFYFFMGATIISPYLVIDFLIGVVRNIFSKFPNLYNRNILFLSNLVHRFSAYKIILYIVSMLVAGSIFLIGFSYSLFSTVEAQTNESCHFDIIFVETDKYNHISQEEVIEIIKSKGGKIEAYQILECIMLPNYEKIEGRIKCNDSDSIVISQSNYNYYMNSNLEIKTGEMVIVKENNIRYYTNSDEIFTLDGQEKAEERGKIFDKNSYTNSEAFFNTVRKEKLFVITKDKKKYISESIPTSKSRFIVNDKDYERIKEKVGRNAIFKNHLINLNKENDKKTFYGLLDDLREINGGDKNIWQISKSAFFEENAKKNLVEAYRPLFKQEEFEANLKQKGFFFFSGFLGGIMLLIFSWVVLYYKILTEAEDEKERISCIRRIGMTEKEIENVLLKELKIIFIVPIIVGGGFALNYLSVFFYLNPSLFGFMMTKSIIIVIIYSALQTIFYFMSKRKYLNEVLHFK